MASVVTSIGTGSGLPLDTLLTNLMAAESVPLTKLQAKEATAQAKVSAYGQFSSSVSTLRDAIAALTASKLNGSTVTSSDKEIATATSTNTATKGNFSLEVVKLAQSEKAVSPPLASTETVLSPGRMTFTFGSVVDGKFVANPDATPKDVNINTSSNTVAGMRDAINKANIGITATVVNDGSGSRLVFSSTETGAKTSFQISGVSDGSGSGSQLSQFDYDPSNAIDYDAATPATGMRRLLAGRDAELKIDGLAVSKSSNTITDVLDGVTLTLVKAGTTTVAVGQDPSAARTALQGLVTAYNTFRTTATSLSLNTPSATTGETNTSNGPLAGDGLVRDVMAKIRNEIFSPVDGATGQFTSLSSLGVSFQADGTLKLDATIFDKAMAADPTGIAKLFQDGANGEGSKGISTRFSAMLTTFIEKNGSIQSKVDGLDSTTKMLQSQQATLKIQLTQIQARYQKQFVALDQLVTGMNNTTTFLTQQLASLAAMRNS